MLKLVLEDGSALREVDATLRARQVPKFAGCATAGACSGVSWQHSA
jgi:hypothetical protein